MVRATPVALEPRPSVAYAAPKAAAHVGRNGPRCERGATHSMHRVPTHCATTDEPHGNVKRARVLGVWRRHRVRRARGRALGRHEDHAPGHRRLRNILLRVLAPSWTVRRQCQGVPRGAREGLAVVGRSSQEDALRSSRSTSVDSDGSLLHPVWHHWRTTSRRSASPHGPDRAQDQFLQEDLREGQ